jgi:hypothetical protein
MEYLGNPALDYRKFNFFKKVYDFFTQERKKHKKPVTEVREPAEIKLLLP